LAAARVGAILELLQWMWKEYHKPSHPIEKMDRHEGREHETRMIKSYVGKLVTRTNQSLIKGYQRSDGTKSISSGKRSLDARLHSLSNK